MTSTLEGGEGSASRPGRLYITLRLRQDFIVQSNFCIVLYHTDQFHIQLDLVRIMDQWSVNYIKYINVRVKNPRRSFLPGFHFSTPTFRLERYYLSAFDMCHKNPTGSLHSWSYSLSPMGHVLQPSSGFIVSQENKISAFPIYLKISFLVKRKPEKRLSKTDVA